MVAEITGNSAFIKGRSNENGWAQMISALTLGRDCKVEMADSMPDGGNEKWVYRDRTVFITYMV